MTNWHTDYNNFLSGGSWISAFIYGATGAIILGGMFFAGVPDRWWMPVLLIYAIGAISHMLNYGFMAINIQMKVISDYWEQKNDG